MKPTRVTPLMRDIVQAGISACDGVTFSGHAACPACGGTLIGYDTKRKQFAHLTGDDGQKTVYVSVRRFYCSTCRRICYADDPFYPNTRIGSVIIDLCIALSLTLPVYRVASALAALGVSVNRSSCRLYVQNDSSYYVRNTVQYYDASDLFGVHLPRSIIALSTLAAGSGGGDQIAEADILEACGYPSGQRTATRQMFPLKSWSLYDKPE